MSENINMRPELPARLDIFSDPTCPWCYIGKAGLDRALAEAPDNPFAIQWHPFQLNPDMPRAGMERRAYLRARFGSEEAVVKAHLPVMEHAERAGLTINLSAMKRMPNTLDAHRLIHWAGIERCQNAAVDALFAAYFVEGRDIGDHETLADIADSIGMDAAVVLRLLQSGSDVENIRERDAEARRMGIGSVPTFIVAGRHAVPGAQPSALWLEVISELLGGAE